MLCLSVACSASARSTLEAGGTLRAGILAAQFPPKSEGKELKILVQPETQHRARYLTEGSRGSVKDRTQQGFPTVKVSHHHLPTPPNASQPVRRTAKSKFSLGT